jgi:hypothetical protein
MIKTKREEKLEEQLRICRASLRLEKQKNKGFQKYKLQSKALAQKLKEAESIKKTGCHRSIPTIYRKEQIY